MKYLYFIFSGLLFLGCATSKSATTSVVEEETEEVVALNDTPTQSRFVGVVAMSDTCFILVTEVRPNEFKRLWPINLDAKYKVEGMKLKFNYSIYRASIPSVCEADLAVKVSDITILR